jgi:LDH2 family malate/lactate/ureidoglycolate dehydrogenase
MAGQEQFQRVDAAQLERLVGKIYAGNGVPVEDAAFLGHALVDADLRGVHSHGCRWVTVYTKSIREGHYNLHPDIRTVHDDGATLLLDGDRGLGHKLAAHSMTIAIAV